MNKHELEKHGLTIMLLYPEMSISFHGEKIIFISPIKLFAAFEARAVFPVQSLKTVKSFLQSGNLCEGGFVA